VRTPSTTNGEAGAEGALGAAGDSVPLIKFLQPLAKKTDRLNAPAKITKDLILLLFIIELIPLEPKNPIRFYSKLTALGNPHVIA
jgi:hypothetical protein